MYGVTMSVRKTTRGPADIGRSTVAAFLSMAPIGYITDQYPATSHTFIQREVLALRARGVDVRTFSIHRAGPEHVLSQADREEFATTYALLPVGPRSCSRRTLRAAPPSARVPADARARRCGIRARSRATLALAAVLLRRGDPALAPVPAAGIGHVHAHFASPAADVAHLYARFARRTGPRRRGLELHGTRLRHRQRRPGLLRAKVRDADFVVCVSDYGRSQLMALVDEQHWPKLAVDPLRRGPRRVLAARARRARRRPARRALASAASSPVKGHGVLLEAIATLGRRRETT